jgi:uncharacterized protein YceK
MRKILLFFIIGIILIGCNRYVNRPVERRSKTHHHRLHERKNIYKGLHQHKSGKRKKVNYPFY